MEAYMMHDLNCVKTYRGQNNVEKYAGALNTHMKLWEIFFLISIRFLQ